MAAVEFEIRVVGPVPTTVLEELEHIDVVTEPVDTVPVDTEPVDTVPVDTEPVDTVPVDTEAVVTVPVDTVPVDTVLRGPVQDQAALIGIIIRLQSWGIELRGIRQI